MHPAATTDLPDDSRATSALEPLPLPAPREEGRWIAYWRTVRDIVARPRAFAEGLCRSGPIDPVDARRFRTITIAIAATSVTAFAAGAAWFVAPYRSQVRAAGVPLWVIFLVLAWEAVAVFLRLGTDVPLFLGGAGSKLNGRPATELAPLRHYAAAPLALAPLVLGAAAALPALAARFNLPREMQTVSALAAGELVLGWPLLCWWTPVALVRGAGATTARRVLLGLYLPVHWLLMGILVGLAAGVAGFVVRAIVEALARH